MVVREYIWISDSFLNKIYLVKKFGVIGFFLILKLFWVGVFKFVFVEGIVIFVLYDELSNFLWVIDGKGEKVYGYKLLFNGDIVFFGLVFDRVIYIGVNV